VKELELVQRRHFLSAEECAGLIELINQKRRPSTLADENGDAEFRTSETCDLPAEHPLVAAVSQRLAAFVGIEPQFGEPLQGQHYAPGQQFKAHTDYFEPNGADFEKYCTVSGNRTWTAMVYLNVPEAGGATRFKHINKTIQPEVGKLLAWNNRDSAGGLNPWTLHEGMKVYRGAKYIITQWYRERPWGW
jgi:prolyl 4-hydroxylase